MRGSVLFLIVCVWAGVAAGADEWPAFRGPNGDGHAEASGLPTTWSETEHVKWKTPVHGKAWSSPVISNGQVWMTTATEDGKQLFAVCLDRETGKVVYDLKVFDVEKPAFCIAFNSYASSTPVIEDGRVYIHFGSAGTACLDTATAKVLWTRRDLPCNHFRGPGSSPILYRNLLIVNFDGSDYQYVVALDKHTGKTVWKTDRDIDYGTRENDDGDTKKAFCTPRVIEVEGVPQLVSPAAMATLAYAPLTGETLWRVRHGGMNAAARPLYAFGLVFITNGSGKMLTVRPQGRGDITEKQIEWQTSRSVPTRSSPLVIGEELYMVSDGGVASCLNGKTGKPIWEHRLEGKYTASPVYADGKIFCLSEDGFCPVLEPAKEFKQLANNRLDDGFMASPAVAGKALYLRSRTHVYRVEQ